MEYPRCKILEENCTIQQCYSVALNYHLFALATYESVMIESRTRKNLERRIYRRLFFSNFNFVFSILVTEEGLQGVNHH